MKVQVQKFFTQGINYLLPQKYKRRDISETASAVKESAIQGGHSADQILGLVATMSVQERDQLAKKLSLAPRALSLAVVERDDGRYLVDRGYDSLKKVFFFRLLGGGIDFGEYSKTTIAREIQEELDFSVVVGEHLGTLENIFTFNGKMGHEIAFVYRASFIDQDAYKKQSFLVADTHRDPTVAVWKSLREMAAEGAGIFPEGTSDMLRAAKSARLSTRDDPHGLNRDLTKG